MRSNLVRFAVVGGGLSAVLLASGPLAADDYFLTIGGGYSPTGNQVSLEKNVQLFQRFVDEQYPSGAQHDVFFADGDDAGRDIQFADPDLPLPQVNLLLARLFRQTSHLRDQYRTHQVPAVRDSTSRANIEKWFDEMGSQLKAGDRLFVYVTAHGGRSTDKKRPHNTRLMLWNSQSLQMQDWVKLLDKLPAEIPVVAVMVQCYCGGFADMMFNGGDASKGMAGASRCGFFATTHARPAAGCTPDINEEDYHEYSTYFWEAIRGRTRTGQPLALPDYDGDGDVSCAEAHAYALLTSTSVDISVKTSDAFLRAFSSTTRRGQKPASAKGNDAKGNDAKGNDAKGNDAKGNDAKASKAQPPLERTEDAEPGGSSRGPAGSSELLTADAPFEQLMALASPAEQAVLAGLSAELGLDQPQRSKEAKRRAEDLMKDKKKLEGQFRKKSGEYSGLAGRIRQLLTNRWPELNNRWHPAVSKLLSEDADEVVQLIESHPSYARLEKLRVEIEELSESRLELDRQWAKCQRLIRTLENVALAANLPQVASSEVQRQYRQLLAAESASFGPQKPTKAKSP